MIEFEGLRVGNPSMGVTLRSEFGDLHLTFRNAWGSSYTDVTLSGDGWSVAAESQEAKESLAKVLKSLDREMFEKLRALGALATTYQSRHLAKLEDTPLDELRELESQYKRVKSTVNKVVQSPAKHGENQRILVLPGRSGPSLVRMLVRFGPYASAVFDAGKNGRAVEGTGYMKALVEWDGFDAAVRGEVTRWERTDPLSVWKETRPGNGAQKAIKLLRELSEEGFRLMTAAVISNATE